MHRTSHSEKVEMSENMVLDYLYLGKLCSGNTVSYSYWSYVCVNKHLLKQFTRNHSLNLSVAFINMFQVSGCFSMTNVHVCMFAGNCLKARLKPG